jgi:hypothetical protein
MRRWVLTLIGRVGGQALAAAEFEGYVDYVRVWRVVLGDGTYPVAACYTSSQW